MHQHCAPGSNRLSPSLAIAVTQQNIPSRKLSGGASDKPSSVARQVPRTLARTKPVSELTFSSSDGSGACLSSESEEDDEEEDDDDDDDDGNISLTFRGSSSTHLNMEQLLIIREQQQLQRREEEEELESAEASKRTNFKGNLTNHATSNLFSAGPRNSILGTTAPGASTALRGTSSATGQQQQSKTSVQKWRHSASAGSLVGLNPGAPKTRGPGSPGTVRQQVSSSSTNAFLGPLTSSCSASDDMPWLSMVPGRTPRRSSAGSTSSSGSVNTSSSSSGTGDRRRRQGHRSSNGNGSGSGSVAKGTSGRLLSAASSPSLVSLNYNSNNSTGHLTHSQSLHFPAAEPCPPCCYTCSCANACIAPYSATGTVAASGASRPLASSLLAQSMSSGNLIEMAATGPLPSGPGTNGSIVASSGGGVGACGFPAGARNQPQLVPPPPQYHQIAGAALEPHHHHHHHHQLTCLAGRNPIPVNVQTTTTASSNSIHHQRQLSLPPPPSYPMSSRPSAAMTGDPASSTSASSALQTPVDLVHRSVSSPKLASLSGHRVRTVSDPQIPPDPGFVTTHSPFPESPSSAPIQPPSVFPGAFPPSRSSSFSTLMAAHHTPPPLSQSSLSSSTTTLSKKNTTTTTTTVTTTTTTTTTSEAGPGVSDAGSRLRSNSGVKNSNGANSTITSPTANNSNNNSINNINGNNQTPAASLLNNSSVDDARLAEPAHPRKKPPLKIVGLKIFNARFHFLLGLSRGISVLPCAIGAWSCLWDAYAVRRAMMAHNPAFASLRSSQLVLAAVWCVVAGYLAYSVLDGLMDRWLVTYSTPAVIVRLVSSAVLTISMMHALVSILAPDTTYRLHVWILISCILTVAYTVQNFVTSNLSLEKKRRSVDLYNISVFAVVPVGLASFLTMLGLLRSIMILQYQYEDLL